MLGLQHLKPQRLQQAFRGVQSPRGVVLDLRGDPGGLLPPAVELANMFIDEGTIVTVVGRSRRLQTHEARSQTPYRHVPLVVLIDARTASAAELLAGALKQERLF